MLQEYENTQGRGKPAGLGEKEKEKSSLPSSTRHSFHPSPQHFIYPEGDPEMCLLSVWLYVSVHLEAFTNPLYEPSGKPLSADEDERLESTESYRQFTPNAMKEKTPAAEAATAGISEKGRGHIQSHPPLTAAAIYSGGIVRSQCVDKCPQLKSGSIDIETSTLHVRTSHERIVEGVEIPSCRQHQQRPSDEDLEFRSRTYGSVSDADTLGALKGLTAAELVFEEEEEEEKKEKEREERAPPHMIVNDNITELKRTQRRELGIISSNVPAAPLLTEAELLGANKYRRQQKRKTRHTGTSIPDDVTSARPSFPKSEVALKRWVHLLTPNFEVSSLLLWEAVYFNQLASPAGVKVKAHTKSPTTNGAPPSMATPPRHSHTHTTSGKRGESNIEQNTSTTSSFTFNTASSSVLAYERGLDALCRQQQNQLRKQEQELMLLRQLVVTTRNETERLESKLTLQSTLKPSAIDNDNAVLRDDGVEEGDECLEFMTPTSRSCTVRGRTHTDSSILSASSSGSQLIVGTSHASPQPSDEDSKYSMHSNYSNKSSTTSFSSASSLFQRHFRFHHPTTLLFSPPLACPLSVSASSTASSIVTAFSPGTNTTPPSPRCKITTPPTGSVSTVLAMNRFQHREQRHRDDTESFSSFLHSPTSGLRSGYLDDGDESDSRGRSISSDKSSQSTHVSIIATATLLEDHY